MKMCRIQHYTSTVYPLRTNKCPNLAAHIADHDSSLFIVNAPPDMLLSNQYLQQIS